MKILSFQIKYAKGHRVVLATKLKVWNYCCFKFSLLRGIESCLLLRLWCLNGDFCRLPPEKNSDRGMPHSRSIKPETWRRELKCFPCMTDPFCLEVIHRWILLKKGILQWPLVSPHKGPVIRSFNWCLFFMLVHQFVEQTVDLRRHAHLPRSFQAWAQPIRGGITM